MSTLTGALSRPSGLTRHFYVGMGLLCAAVALWGFSGTYWQPMLREGEAFAGVIHLHAAVFYGWVLFFILQASLASGGSLRRHRSLGWGGAALALLVVVVGVTIALHQLANGIAAGQTEQAQRFTIVPLTDIVFFGGFVGLAVLNRHRGEVHKRLMLLATLTLLPAAIARLTFPIYGPSLIPLAVVLGCMVALAILFDLYTRHRVHPVYWIGGVLIVASLPLRQMAHDTAAWLNLTGVLVRLVS